ncbi:hypothetical protein BC941DRAFT_429968 [Chlamydoabsidia padenii]|nr:hypothetical protein BC941DRAFT_429968 [Chlamydoabsidia padenii]
MFSRIIDTLRNSHNNSRQHDIPDINVGRRSSDDQDTYNNNNSNTIPIPNHPSTRNGNSTGAIGIKSFEDESSLTTSDSLFNKDVRRRSSLFGYSTNAADDYMQKDLLSSSWS